MAELMGMSELEAWVDELSLMEKEQDRRAFLVQQPHLRTQQSVQKLYDGVVHMAGVDLKRAERLAEAATWTRRHARLRFHALLNIDFENAVNALMLLNGHVQGAQEPKRVIIRAIGPELGQYGVPNPLADPTLELHDGTGALIASNDDWQHTIIGGIITTNQVSAIQNSGHAPTQPSESAIIAELPAGNYTAIVRGVNNTTGVALVEVFDLH